MWDLCPNAKTIVWNAKHSVGSAGFLAKRKSSFPDALISLQKGNIPVVISVPHGGTAKDKAYGWQKANLAPRVAASTNMSDFGTPKQGFSRHQHAAAGI